MKPKNKDPRVCSVCGKPVDARGKCLREPFRSLHHDRVKSSEQLRGLMRKYE